MPAPRELIGVFTKLATYADLTKKPVTLETAEEAVGLRSGPGAKTSIEDIQRKTAEFYKLEVKDFHSPQRARRVARPRQVAMYLSRKLTTPLAARDRAALRRPRPHHGAACLPPHRGADRGGSAVPPGSGFPAARCCQRAARCKSFRASKSPGIPPSEMTRGKPPVLPCVFLALCGLFWYGLALKSWGRSPAAFPNTRKTGVSGRDFRAAGNQVSQQAASER